MVRLNESGKNMKLLDIFKLKKEANLMDSKLFILKTFLAIFTAYVVGSNHHIVSKDMISVLFGLVLTLEPVNIAGIRGGWSQVYATLIGAVTTGLIISLFGISAWTIALSVALTLYITLKIDWKQISPVALFTAIYMTQFLQYDQTGEVSILLTMQLRLMALGTGVLVAVFYNFVFSIIQYRVITSKRIILLFDKMIGSFDATKVAILKTSSEQEQVMNQITDVTKSIEWFSSVFKDLSKEFNAIPIWSSKKKALADALVLLEQMHHLTHLLYDINYSVLHFNELEDFKQPLSESLGIFIENLHDVQSSFVDGHSVTLRALTFPDAHNVTASRIIQDMNKMHQHLENVVEHLG